MDFPYYSTCLVLCGTTGSGKSLLLHQLELSGYPCINLEEIASHKGSAFGHLSYPPQPSQPEFENTLQKACARFNGSEYIFIEQKPLAIGKRRIPTWLSSKMKDGILIQLDTIKEVRINNILKDYVPAGKHKLLAALHNLTERLPATTVLELERYLDQDNYEMFIEKMINYYDATINYQLPKKATIILEITSNDFTKATRQLLQLLPHYGIDLSHVTKT